MKSFYTLLLSGLLTMLASGLVAQDLSVALTDEEGAVGETVCLDFIGENFVGIKGLTFSVIYDPEVLTFVSGDAGLDGNTILIVANPSAPGVIRVSYFTTAAIGFTSDPGPFDFGDLCFEVLTDEATSVAFAGVPVPINFVDDQNVELPVTTTDGSVNANGPPMPTCSDGIQNGDETGVDCGGSCTDCSTASGCGADTDDVQICVGSVCADAGAEVCVPVFVGNFDMLGGFQFRLAYEADNLEYTRFTAANDRLEFGATVASSEDGLVGLAWNDPDLTGLTFPADEPAYQLCFTAENAQPTPLTFSNPGTTLRAFDAVGNGLPITSSPGAVNVGCGDVPTCSDGIQNGNETGVDCGGSCQPCMTTGGPNRDCGMSTDDLSICLGTNCDVPVGQETCVDITVGNFMDVTALNFDVTFPESNLTFTRVTSSSLLSDALLANDRGMGVVRLQFFQPDQSGQDLVDGSNLGTICFTNNTAAETPLSLSQLAAADTDNNSLAIIGNPGSINGCGPGGATCDDGIQNGDETGVDCGGACAPCMMSGGPNRDCGMNTDDLSICLGTNCDIAVGEETCVDITVGNFTNVTALNFDVTFPEANLTFTRVTSSPLLSDELLANDRGMGVVRLQFFQPAQMGQDLVDGDNLGTICFTNNTADETILNLAQLAAVDTDNNSLAIVANPGSINGCVSTCDDGIQNGDETGIDCGGACQPCMTGGGGGPNRDCGMDTDDLSICLGTNCNVAVGEETCVDITVGNFTNVTALNFDVTFPEANLTFTRVTSSPLLSDELLANDRGMGVVRLQFFQPAQTGQDLVDGDNLGTICFTNNTADETILNLAQLAAVDTDNNSLAIVANPGSINGCVSTCDDGIQNGDEEGVDCGGSCQPCVDPPGDVNFQITDETAAFGTEVCVDVLATGLSDAGSYQFPIRYDASKLTFVRVTGFGDFTSTTSTLPAPGDLRVTWSGAGGTAVDGAAIFEMCFTVVEACNTSIDVVNAPGFPLEVLNSMDVAFRSANVTGGTVNAGVPCDDTPAPGNIVLDLGMVNGAVGESVCLDLEATDFTTITNLSFSLTYDPAIVSFLEANSFGLAGLGVSNVANPTPGTITFDWNSPTAGGETLADGATVLSFCFSITELTGTDVVFTDSPIIIDAANSNGDQVRVVPIDGRINPKAPSVDGLTFIIGSDGGAVGETVCLPVTAYGLDDLTSFEYRIRYDATIVSYTGLDDDIDFPYPGRLFVVSNSPGLISTSWADPSGQGDTDVSDGTILYGMCFEVLVAQATPIFFSDDPTEPDFSTTQGVVPGMVVDGEINGSDAPMFVSTNQGDPTCAGLNNGFITVTIFCPEEVTYEWTGTDATGPVANNLGAGTYTVTVTNQQGESIERSFTLTAPPAFNIDVDEVDPISCNGEADGRIALTTAGGVMPFTINWSGSLTDGVLEQTDLSAGLYSVTITDANGCRRQRRDIEIVEPDPIVVTGTVSGTGTMPRSIDITVAGGQGNLTFAWTGPNGFTATTDDISGLTDSGEYCVTATDGNECTGRACFTITVDNTADLVATAMAATVASCFDAADGRVVLTLTGGLAPFTITINPGGQTVTSDDRTVNLDLAAGDYTFTVTGAGGRTTMATATVTAPDAISGTTTFVSDTEDMGCSGMISLNLVGGTPDYSILWSNGATTMTITELCAGTYSATVTDANGCTFTTDPVEVGQLQEDFVSSTDASCEDAADGSVDVTIFGGVAPYTFSWVSVSSNEVVATTEDLTNAPSGNYRLTATDATGASIVRLYAVGQAAGFTVTAEVTSLRNGFGVSCADAVDGQITATVAGGGTFTYEYFLGEQLVGADPVLTGVGPGVYTVRVTGDGGCESTRMVTITAPPAIAVTATVNDLSCNDVRDGSITAMATGGVGTYTFDWSDGSSTRRITGLSAGAYSLTVTDANGCTAVQQYTLTAPDDLAFTLDATDATDDCNGSIQVLPLGGSGNFTYSWPGLPNQGNNPFAQGLCPGNYTVIVSDENGCQAVTMVATVLDRRFPCLSTRTVLTPNGDAMNETLVIFCSGENEVANNTIQIFNRWGQLVYEVDDYDCSDDGGLNCFEGRTNDGDPLAEGAYYYVLDYMNPNGERLQQQGSFTIIRD